MSTFVQKQESSKEELSQKATDNPTNKAKN
jgi:hypothetical protein